MFRSGGKVNAQINAEDDWTEVVAVRKGDVLVISAAGKWMHGKDPKRQECGPGGVGDYGYLEGRIGEKKFRINEGITITSESDGILSLRMYDTLRTDNSGFVTVTITKKN